MEMDERKWKNNIHGLHDSEMTDDRVLELLNDLNTRIKEHDGLYQAMDKRLGRIEKELLGWKETASIMADKKAMKAIKSFLKDRKKNIDDEYKFWGYGKSKKSDVRK